MPNVWDTVVYAGMKNAVISALLCCQDEVEQRKVSNRYRVVLLYRYSFVKTQLCTRDTCVTLKFAPNKNVTSSSYS